MKHTVTNGRKRDYEVKVERNGVGKESDVDGMDLGPRLLVARVPTIHFPYLTHTSHVLSHLSLHSLLSTFVTQSFTHSSFTLDTEAY